MWRRITASVLVVLGALLLMISSFGWWANRYFLNSERFSAKAGQILENEEVQNALVFAITEQISDASGRDLRIAQPFIGTIVREVVSSPQFEKLFDAAILRAHRAVVEGDARQMVLNLSGIVDDVKGALDTVAPNLAEKIPEGDKVTVRTLDKTQLDTIYDITNLAKKLVVGITILSLLLIAGGVALSTRRWRTLALAGWVTLGAFAFSLIAVVTGRIVTGSFVKQDEYSSAAESAYRIIARGLIVQAIVIGILAIIVALLAGWIDRHGGWAAARDAMRKGTTWARAQMPKKAEPAVVGAGGGTVAMAGTSLSEEAGTPDTSVAVDETQAPAAPVSGVLAPRLPEPARKARTVHWWRAVALLVVGLYAVFNPRSLTSIVVVIIGVAALYLAITEALAAWATPREPKLDDGSPASSDTTGDESEVSSDA